MEGMSNLISSIANGIGGLLGNMWIAIPVVAILLIYFLWIRKKK